MGPDELDGEDDDKERKRIPESPGARLYLCIPLRPIRRPREDTSTSALSLRTRKHRPSSQPRPIRQPRPPPPPLPLLLFLPLLLLSPLLLPSLVPPSPPTPRSHTSSVPLLPRDVPSPSPDLERPGEGPAHPRLQRGREARRRAFARARERRGEYFCAGRGRGGGVVEDGEVRSEGREGRPAGRVPQGVEPQREGAAAAVLGDCVCVCVCARGSGGGRRSGRG